jgi:hypothetical protein
MLIINTEKDSALEKNDNWKYIVLIISLSCIVITIIASSILIPVLFRLESE